VVQHQHRDFTVQVRLSPFYTIQVSIVTEGLYVTLYDTACEKSRQLMRVGYGHC